MRARISMVALLAMIPGCLIDVPAPEDGTFACETSDDCAKDWACQDGICVDPSAPTTVWCGNNRRDEGEACDGGDLGGASCTSINLGSGNLGCTGDCDFDTSGCSSTQVCNNDTVEGTEVCDGNSFAEGHRCVDQGFDGGTPTCVSSCTQVDYSTCEPCVSCGAEACVHDGQAYLCAARCADPGQCDTSASCVPTLDFKGEGATVCKACNAGDGCDAIREHCEWTNPDSTAFADADVQCFANWFDLTGSGVGSGIADPTGPASLAPDIAIVQTDNALKAGNVLVAWQEGDATGSHDILLRVFNAGVWGDLGNSGVSPGLSATNAAANPALALGGDGRPVVVWEDANGMLFLKALDSADRWSPLGQSATAPGVNTESAAQAFGPDLTIENAEIRVGWGQTGSGYGSFAFRGWNGSAWSAVRTTNAASDQIMPPAAANSAGEGLFITFPNYDHLQMNTYSVTNGVAVSLTQTLANTLDPADAPALAAQGNAVIGVWRDRLDGNLFYRTSSDGGVTFDSIRSIPANAAPGEVAAAVSPSGVPIVAWVAAGTYQSVRVARLDGTQWVGLGNSMDDDVFSLSGLDASHPALAVGPNPHDPYGGGAVVCVTWSQKTSGNPGIHVRCHPIDF